MIERKELEELYDTGYSSGKIDGQLYLLKEIIELYNHGMSLNNIINYKIDALKKERKEFNNLVRRRYDGK